MSFYSPYFRPLAVQHVWMRMAFMVAFMMMFSACSSSENIVAHQITVEGRTVYMGNVPFNELILKTENNNSYILKMDQAMLDELMTPAWLRVTGILSRGEWNGKPFAQIQVLEMVRIEQP